LRRVDQLAARSPRPETWLVRRAEILIEAGRRADARQTFLAALQAIEVLPPRHRATTATKLIETRVRQQLLQFDPTKSEETRQYADRRK
jgi:hypothetical protein